MKTPYILRVKRGCRSANILKGDTAYNIAVTELPDAGVRVTFNTSAQKSHTFWARSRAYLKGNTWSLNNGNPLKRVVLERAEPPSEKRLAAWIQSASWTNNIFICGGQYEDNEQLFQELLQRPHRKKLELSDFLVGNEITRTDVERSLVRFLAQKPDLYNAEEISLAFEQLNRECFTTWILDANGCSGALLSQLCQIALEIRSFEYIRLQIVHAYEPHLMPGFRVFTDYSKFSRMRAALVHY